MRNSREKGIEAELFVVRHLESLGFEILQRNFLIRGGEIDIIAKQDHLLVFVEVRSWERQFWDNGTPLETINRAKMKRIERASLHFIAKNRINMQKTRIRFDVAGLIREGAGFSMKYIENAFQSGGVI